MSRSKKIMALFLSIVMVLGLLPASAFAANDTSAFSDVKTSAWYHEDVQYVSENGLMKGTGENLFSPDATTTRGMIVTILYRLEGEPSPTGACPFQDVASGKYYEKAITWAAENGIVSGFSADTFGSDQNITREQMAAILYRYATYKKYDVSTAGDLSKFPDADKVSSYAVDAMKWANAAGLINGSSDGKLYPAGNATRAQVAAILTRFCKNIAAQCTVTFQLNYGSEGTYTTLKVAKGDTITAPKAPTRSGYTFSSWSEKTSGSAFDFKTPIEKDITLYAQWSKKSSSGSAALPTPTPEPEDETVPAEIAELFGFDPDEYDTDGDGLSNYDEIYVVGTDPTIKDTDGNGINDAEDDSDGDLLSNIQEIEYKTNPLKPDTDFDGLSDYEEINKYGTDPCKEDTDADGLSDGDEIILGLDPLRQRTDGATLDSERNFTQQLSEENISDALLGKDNDAVPSLTVTQKGNANNEVFIEETSSKAFSDSRAIVGKAIDINGSSFTEGILSFELNDTDMAYIITEDTDEVFPTLLVCKYNDGGETEYLETEYDNGILSAEINGPGAYFVLNVKNLFDELGLALPTISDVSTLSDSEPLMLELGEEENADQNNVNESGPISPLEVEGESNSVAASADTVKVTAASSGVMAQADIVFIVDTTSSMGDEINNVKNNISYFVDALNEKGVSAALALIDYEDITVDGYDSTRVHKNGSSNWFYDVNEYKTAIGKLSLGGGGDTPECVVDALETARLLDMRASAGKIFVLVTDADYKVDNRYDIPSMAAEIELLKNAGVNCSVVSPSSQQSTYYNLYTETNGVWANIYGNFYEELMVLADKIGGDIVGDGYWIYLDGPVPVPVRLDAAPEEGSTVDTDADGIPDIQELEGVNPSGYIDLDLLISKISKGSITNTNYGIVASYKYKSNPVEQDSDYDGILDSEEVNSTERLNNSFTGTMLGYYNIADATYTFDYSKFFNSASVYSHEICSASLMMSNTIYDDCGFAYNTSGKKFTDITEMMVYHGFKNVIDYKLADGYDSEKIFAKAYKDDDISEICIGSHEVKHDGITKTILAVVVRGTNGTIEEWSSNFDMGDTKAWNEEIHKGFYITEERIKDFISQYVDVYLKNAEGLTYWITGHSRGAALANVLSAKLIDEGNDVYAYTFAAPSTTISKNKYSEKYGSIFNLTNISDFVTYVPLREWDFDRFGVTLPVSIEAGHLEEEWSKQTGVKKYNALNMSVITLATNRIARSCCASWDEVYDRAGAQDIDDKQYSYISDRAMRYCDLVERNSILGNHKGWKLYPSTAFVFQLGAEMLGGSPIQQNNVKSLIPEFWNSKYAGVILLFVGDALRNAGSFMDMELGETLVGDGHAPATYYVLTNSLRT